MNRLIAALMLALALTSAADAACNGQDLIAAMPEADRLALAHAAGTQPYARGNFWRATRNGQVIHLVGTYHFPDPRHDRVMPLIDRMLASAQIVLVEAGPEEEAALARELTRRPEFMFLTEGPTLPELLPEADWQVLSAAMRLRGVPPFLASKMRPWYMAMLLNLPPCAMPAMKGGERGLDERIIASALARGLPVKALEPFDTLFQIFEPLTIEQELDLIRLTLPLANQAEDYTETLSNAYFRGESRVIWEFTRDQARRSTGSSTAVVDEQFALMEEVMRNARNRAWIPVLVAAAERGEVLAAFGALHLPGEQGVLALLAARGFSIAPLGP